MLCNSGPGPCFGNATCSLYSQLNFINGYNQFSSAQAVQRSDHSGTTDQLFNWLCNAPVVPLDFGTKPTESIVGCPGARGRTDPGHRTAGHFVPHHRPDATGQRRRIA